MCQHQASFEMNSYTVYLGLGLKLDERLIYRQCQTLLQTF